MHYRSILDQLRAYTNIAVAYGLVVGFSFFVLSAPLVHAAPTSPLAKPSKEKPFVARKLDLVPVSGRPVRVVIPSRAIDLPIEPGYYNESDGSWTLSGYKAHFAMMSAPANNIAGNTLVYGHNNNDVFGALRHAAPASGAEAFIHTDTGQVFVYAFQAAHSVTPNDTGLLQYQGPPVMTILTCTGSMDEWRTLYQFNFVRVAQ